MKANNTIQINGKTYDARTGELISAAKKTVASVVKKLTTDTAAAKKPTPSRQQKRGNGFVDGIARNPNAPKFTAKPKKLDPKPTEAHRHSIAHATKPVRRAIHHSATLNRAGVKAPRLQAPDTAVVKTVGRKSAATPSQRLERAINTAKSPIISRFNHSAQPAQPEAKETAEHHGSELSMAHIAQAAEKVRGAHHSRQVKNELIAQSLAEANKMNKQHAHKQAKAHKSRAVSATAAVFAALVLAGYVAYLNVPSLSVKFASSRAGFAATLPSQTPAGYSMRGPIAYSPGQVIINFGSNTDSRRFSIQQQPSTWDSEALKENFVAKNTATEPTTYQDNGLTIYIYDGGNAAWVNNGKFYSIKSANSGLDTQQVLDIATSM